MPDLPQCDSRTDSEPWLSDGVRVRVRVRIKVRITITTTITLRVRIIGPSTSP